MAVVPRSEWVDLSHRLIHHGRRVCLARKPRCGECALAADLPQEGRATGPGRAADAGRRVEAGGGTGLRRAARPVGRQHRRPKKSPIAVASRVSCTSSSRCRTARLPG